MDHHRQGLRTIPRAALAAPAGGLGFCGCGGGRDSFAVMEAEGITDVLGVDDDFTVQGFRLLQ